MISKTLTLVSLATGQTCLDAEADLMRLWHQKNNSRTIQKKENIMSQKKLFQTISKCESGTYAFVFALIHSWKARSINLIRKTFGPVFYGLTILHSSMQIVLLSLSVIATYQFFLKQVSSQGNIKNGGEVVLSKDFHSTISCNTSRIHNLLSQFGG